MKKKTLLVAPVLALIPSIAAAEVNQPQEIIDRPRTLPAGELQVGGDISLWVVDGNPTGMTLGGAYGVNEKLEAGVSYGFALKEFEAKGSLDVHAAYSLLNAGNLTLAGDVGVGYNINGEALNPLGLGAELQYKLGPKMAIFSPGQQLEIGLEEPNAITLGLPVGFAYQASPALHVAALTEIANISLKDSTTTVILDDFTPLAVQVTYSPSNTLDLSAGIGLFDLLEGESYKHPILNVGANLYL